MNILAIGAHPDDIEYGCGGALIKYSHLGHQVHLLIMTKGEIGARGNKRLREKEQLRSSKILHAKKVFWDAEFTPDSYLVFGRKTRGFPESLIEKYGKLFYKIPMTGKIRSLNLSSSVAVALYEAVRQTSLQRI